MESTSINAAFPTSQFVQSLNAWFSKNQRDLPWRHPHNARDAYRVLVSEVMLQQTTVKAVVPFYTRFLERFPDVHTLASASIEDVLPFWAGLGYYSRARMLHKCAQTVVENGGVFPESLDRVLELPGIGRYTAGAVTSIAFDAQNPIVDANVARVFSRIFIIDGDLKNRANQNILWQHATEVVQHCDEENPPSQVNPAMMELGALVCVPKNPRCEACPVQDFCSAFASGRQNELPFIAAKRDAVLLNDVCAFAMQNTTQTTSSTRCRDAERETRILLRQRAHEPGIWWRGMWELPRTTIAENETVETALVRLFRDELGIDNINIGDKIKSLRHGVTHHDITLDCYQIDIEYSNQSETVRWFSWTEIENLALPSTMKRLLDWLQTRENTAQGSLF